MQNEGQGKFTVLVAIGVPGLGEFQIIPLADGKINVHGVGGGDFGQQRVVALADQIAGVDVGLADAPGDGGGDAGIAQVALGRVHGGLGVIDIGGKFALVGQARVVFVATHSLLLVKLLKPGQIDFGLGEKGVLAFQLGLGLLQILLILARFNNEEQIAFLYD